MDNISDRRKVHMDDNKHSSSDFLHCLLSNPKSKMAPTRIHTSCALLPCRRRIPSNETKAVRIGASSFLPKFQRYVKEVMDKSMLDFDKNGCLCGRCGMKVKSYCKRNLPPPPTPPTPASLPLMSKDDVPPYLLQNEISTEENMVTISANSSKFFFKKLSLPLGVRHEEITSSLSREGTLTISAPIHAEDVQKQIQVVSSPKQNVGSSSMVTSSKVSQSFTTSSVSCSQTQSQQQQIASSSNISNC